jgi:hypothetical protein
MPARFAFAIALTLLSLPAGRAEFLPTFPLRELAVRADVVVLAEPVAAARPGTYRVRELLKGPAPRVGAQITVERIESCVRPGEQPNLALVDAALLFLRASATSRFELIESGVRLRMRDGKVWWPLQVHNPGPYHMTPEAGVDWDTFVMRARSDAAEATRVQEACGLADVAQRDSCLLEWVERHRHEFSDGREGTWNPFSAASRNRAPGEAQSTELDAFGWGQLQILPFARVLQGRVPADCLRAVSLYAELNRGAVSPGAAAAFASREGRKCLLAEAHDSRQLDGHRARALRLLGDRAVVEAEPPGDRERSDLVDGLSAFLNDRVPTRRGLAARALVQLAGQGGALNEQTVKAVRAAYKAEQPGPARNALAESLYDIAGPQRWPALSGGHDSSLALLRDLDVRDDKLFFWLTLKTEPPATVTEAPTLFLERLDVEGLVVETKKVPVVLPAPARAGGWNGGPVYVELRHADLNPGTWRLRVTGTTGRGKPRWESEPRTVQVVVPGRAQARPERSVLGNLLRTIAGAPEMPEAAAPPGDAAKRKVVLDGEPF